MKRFSANTLSLLLMSCFVVFSCTKKESFNEIADEMALTWESVQDTTDIVVSIDGLSGPEAVRYDPDQDVYFVSNMNGDAAGDANGFISKVSPDGTIDSLHFMTGTETHPLHGPRGMYITGDTLWVCDAEGIHGFNRMTGEQVNFVDFTSFEPGFLNDIVAGVDGSLYVTDTGKSMVYIIENGEPSVLVEGLPAPPNGITIDAGNNLVLAPWDGATTFPTLVEGDPGYAAYTQAQGGGNFDGIEFLDGHLIAASQADSTLHVLYEDNDHIAIHTPGRPADIGLDTKRHQIAVPYIALNRVDIWQFPE